ncbi:uncharacterized protein TNCV_255541 [Trichonephila clavipes]|nr:uncharacterized protein TNCV_255541 [Trichonephila clavipes]
MVWGSMSSYGVARIPIVSGTVKAMDYIEILENKLLPTARDLFGNQSWIFKDDNAPCHHAKVVQKWLKDHTVNIMNWPEQSPDLSLIDNLWFLKSVIKFQKKIELREDLKSRRGLSLLEKGGAAARMFCGLMNLPPPPAKFERHNSLFLNVLKTISEDSMNAAVHEAVIANDNNSNIAVAVDGTCHKRGYSSLNGVVYATSVENRKWGMECRGVLSIFQRSETSRKACYTQYLGDGDSKGFLTIKEEKVYGDTEVEK